MPLNQTIVKNCFLKILSIIILLSITNCSSYIETKYYPNTKLTSDPFLKKINAESNDKSILYFTSGFDDEIIECKSGNEIIFKENVRTISQLSLAKVEAVSNLHDITITVNSESNKTIILKSENLKQYKYVFISKDSDKSKKEYLVEFTNKGKVFY